MNEFSALSEEPDMTTVLHLLSAATEGGPTSDALLDGVRRHEQRRRRTRRVLIPALSLATAGGLAIAAISTVNSVSPVSSGNPPTATLDAQHIVLAAATRTSLQSYSVQAGGWKGAFDPARRLGWFSEPGGGQIRYVGDTEYVEVVRQSTMTPPNLPARIHWMSSPRMTADSRIPLAVKLLKDGAQDPQDELAALREATTVKRSGTASGPGWTGVHYTFTLPPTTGFGAVGAVDLDTQGRVRNLDLTLLSDGKAQRRALASSHMRFGDFGVRVDVVAPPADQVIPIEQTVPKKR